MATPVTSWRRNTENKTMNEFYTTSNTYDNPNSALVNSFTKDFANRVNIVSGKHGVPLRGSKEAAGYDLKADLIEPITVASNQTVKVSTGIKIHLPEGTAAFILPRSGLAYRSSITVANSPGLIDSDYRGEICVLVRNEGTEPYRINDGDRIAQLMIVPYITPSFISVDELSPTIRSAGGFGSTGNR